MTYSKILELIPLAQSSALLSENMKMIKKKKKKTKDFISSGVGNIVGASIIKEGANFLK